MYVRGISFKEDEKMQYNNVIKLSHLHLKEGVLGPGQN
jgi:hypothetical protein